MYDLSQIPFDYTVEVMNRFKGLDLVDRVPEELWTEVCDIVQKAVTKIIPEKKKHKKTKRFSEEALQIVKESQKEVTFLCVWVFIFTFFFFCRATPLMDF